MVSVTTANVFFSAGARLSADGQNGEWQSIGHCHSRVLPPSISPRPTPLQAPRLSSVACLVAVARAAASFCL